MRIQKWLILYLTKNYRNLCGIICWCYSKCLDLQTAHLDSSWKTTGDTGVAITCACLMLLTGNLSQYSNTWKIRGDIAWQIGPECPAGTGPGHDSWKIVGHLKGQALGGMPHQCEDQPSPLCSYTLDLGPQCLEPTSFLTSVERSSFFSWWKY